MMIIVLTYVSVAAESKVQGLVLHIRATCISYRVAKLSILPVNKCEYIVMHVNGAILAECKDFLL